MYFIIIKRYIANLIGNLNKDVHTICIYFLLVYVKINIKTY
jgi:hypothetical protein